MGIGTRLGNALGIPNLSKIKSNSLINYDGVETIGIDQLHEYLPSAVRGQDFSPSQFSVFNGEKFFGGFGDTQIFLTDYWTLRQRSLQLYMENPYAKGIINRLVTNIINKGLTVEATPNPSILGLDEEELNAWSEDVETRFSIWAKNPTVCDWRQKQTFGSLQRTAKITALLSGDVLVVIRQSKVTGLPMIQLIDGGSVQTPIDASPREGNIIIHGVELDKRGRQVAFYVTQGDGNSKRVPAFGEKSKRKIAWLHYGTDTRLDEVRGIPLLASVLQSLKEIDRYKDSELRAAVVNSVLAMFIKKTESKPASMPVSSGAVRNDVVTVNDGTSSTRSFNMSQQIPGIVFEELQQGEEPVGFNPNRPNVNYGPFESSIIQVIAWSNEIPPEVLQLAFSSNYSASRGAVNEFKMFIDKDRSNESENLDEPIYKDWLISKVLLGDIKAPGLLEAWRDLPRQMDIFESWVSSVWTGAIKLSVDLAKDVKAYREMIEQGLITRERAAKELNGGKFSKAVRRLKTENKQLREANQELLFEDGGNNGNNATAQNVEAIIDGLIQALDEREEVANA